MAEIKSALELAMERSQKYVISDEEREKIREKEILEKAMSLFYRQRDGSLTADGLLREIERMDQKVKRKVKGVLVSEWTDALSLDNDSEKTFLAMELIAGQNFDPMKQRLKKLLSSYRKETEKARQKMSAQLAGELKREGIEGDALEPNVEGSNDWERLVRKTAGPYHEKLNEIKKDLKRLFIDKDSNADE